MRHVLLMVGLCGVVVGCMGDAPPQAGDAKDPAPVYEVVIREELKAFPKGAGCYLFIDGKDPAPDFLKQMQKHWPELQPGSKVPKGKAHSVGLQDLKWIDRNTAEVEGGFSNGIDGHYKLYRVVRKDAAWTIESAKTTKTS